MFMDEFSSATRREARSAMRKFFQRELEAEADPVIELIAALLEDGAGGTDSPPDAIVTTEQWMTWNHLVLNGPDALTRIITKELEKEKPMLPLEKESMRVWAAQLLMATLDRLGMA